MPQINPIKDLKINRQKNISWRIIQVDCKMIRYFVIYGNVQYCQRNGANRSNGKRIR